jgi:hypothetical protein
MEINVIHQRRAAQIGRAKGMIWMVSVTLFFALIDLYFAAFRVFLTITIGVAVSAFTYILFNWSLRTLRLAKLLPDKKLTDAVEIRNPMRKWFIIVVVLEVAGFNIAAIVLSKLNHAEYIVPVDILIAALHFIPLGRIFAMPIYYIHGAILSFITILTMLLVPASSQIGNMILLMAIPSVCFILLNWIIIIFILNDAMKYLRKT